MTNKVVQFAKGVKIKTVPTQYGEIIKVGVMVLDFKDNPINEDGWVNFDILTSKNGKKYAAIDTYKSKTDAVDEDIIPF
jgi:hypothetical protein